jgi:hypothetical protein
MTRNTYTITALLLILLPGIIFAQASKPQVPPAAVPVKVEPLSVRKQSIETQLRDISTRLTTIYSRTNIAVARLTEKDVDIKKAQAQLAIANTALISAKLNLDTFAAIPVNDEEKDKVKVSTTTAALKESVLKSETSLKEARDALIATLVSLKAAINISIQEAEY